MQPTYAELHCVSNFSFLRGASHPEELVARAHALGYQALALPHACSLARAVAGPPEGKACVLSLILGTEIRVEKTLKLVLLATDRRSYGSVSSLITAGRRRSAKGGYSLARNDLESLIGSGALALGIPEEDFTPAAWLAERFRGAAWIAAELHCGPNDCARLSSLREISGQSG